jgi:lysozyme
MNLKKLIDQLSIDEGRKNRLYTCTAGKLTIGVGRNLTDRALFEDEIDLMLKNDIALVERQLDESLSWWRQMTDARQNVLVNMGFNLGVPGLLGFKNTLAFMKSGRYDEAAAGMMSSKWAKQVGRRAERLAAIVRSGEFP